MPSHPPLLDYRNSFPILAMDAALRRRLGRDEEAGGDPSDPLEAAAKARDPMSALLTYLSRAMGDNHPHRGDWERMVQDLANWDPTEANDEAGIEGERREAEDVRRARQAHDGTPASRARAAAHAREIAADSAVLKRFPGLHRIGNSY